MKILKSKTAAVTGAASGIGRMLAVNLANEGCNLALADINASGMSDNIFDATLYSAMAWNSYGSIVNGSSTQPYGVLLQNGGASPNLFSVIAAVRNVNYPPHPCVPINNQGTQPPVDGSLFMSYGGTIARHSSASVSMSYRGL